MENFIIETTIYCVENGEKIGRCVIKELENNVFDIAHTYVDENHNGKGIAGKLVSEAIEYIKGRKGDIFASCSYGNHYLEKNNIPHLKNNVSACSIEYMKEDNK